MHRKIYLFLFLLLYVVPVQKILTADVSTSVNVPPNQTDYSYSISSGNTDSTVPQDTTIQYTINYGNNFNVDLPLTIVASWSQGTVNGDSTPSVDVADYVIGSATNAYGSTAAVIDSQNQTITWTISSFPGNTSGQSVSFELKTNDNYTGSKSVSFNQSVYLTTTGLTTSTKSVTDNYLYYVTPSPTPTPVPTAGPTSSPNASATPTPSPTPAPLTINSINVQTASEKSAGILIVTSNPSTVVLNYGTDLKNLNKSVSSNSYSYQTLLTLNDLNSNVNYYYDAVTKDANGNTKISDIFTFKTASSPNSAIVIPSSLVAVSGNIIISKSSSAQTAPTIVLPTSSNFNFKFSLQKAVEVKRAVAFVQEKNILAANTQTNNTSPQTSLIEIQPGVFAGKIDAPQTPGEYEVIAQLTDINGNITEQKIGDLTVVSNFQVLSKSTGQPVEGARVLVYFFNESTKHFELLPPQSISILNPSFTDQNGEIPLILAQGKYEAMVSQIGFKDQKVDFTIGSNNEQGYPTVYLENAKINIFSIINYTSRTLNDIFVKSTLSYASELTGSTRFFNLIAQLSLLILIILAFIAFVTRTHIPLFKIPEYVIFYINKLRGKNVSQNYVSGFIKDGKGFLDNAHVYLVDIKTEEIIQQTVTNKSGHFFFKKKLDKPGIIVMKQGYKTSHLTSVQKIDGDEFRMTIEKIKSEKQRILFIPLKIIATLLSVSFEILLILSLIFELLFLNSYGVLRTLPYLVISLFNLFVWIMYLRVRKHSLNR